MNARERAFAEYNWLSVPEVARAIGAGHDYVRDRIHTAVNGFRFQNVLKKGNRHLIPPSEVERYLQEHTINAA